MKTYHFSKCQKKDQTVNACPLSLQSDPLQITLQSITNLPTGFTILGTEWQQLSGQSGNFCEQSSEICGGNGYNYLYLPPDSLLNCSAYSWSVTVSIANPQNNVSEATLTSCPYTPYTPPVGGTCVLIVDNPPPATSGCAAYQLDRIVVNCSGWVSVCPPGPLTYSANLFSAEANDIVLLDSSSEPVFDFQLGSSSVVFVLICNSAGACTSFEAFDITICPLPADVRTQVYQDTLTKANDCLISGDLSCTRQLNLALAQAYVPCDQQSPYDQSLMGALIDQSAYLYQTYESYANGDPENVVDPTPLFLTWAFLSNTSCNTPGVLFTTLGDACDNSRYSSSVASQSLDQLLRAMNANGNATGNNGNTDTAININSCIQSNVGPLYCAEETYVTYV